MDLFSEDYLAHHGIKGQKWGVRRFQNADGTRTDAGKARYDSSQKKTGSNKRRIAKALAIGAAVATGTVLAIYGAKSIKQQGLSESIEYGRKAASEVFKSASDAERKSNEVPEYMRQLNALKDQREKDRADYRKHSLDMINRQVQKVDPRDREAYAVDLAQRLRNDKQKRKASNQLTVIGR